MQFDKDGMIQQLKWENEWKFAVNSGTNGFKAPLNAPPDKSVDKNPDKGKAK